jgi:hypothetical protein
MVPSRESTLINPRGICLGHYLIALPDMMYLQSTYNQNLHDHGVPSFGQHALCLATIAQRWAVVSHKRVCVGLWGVKHLDVEASALTSAAQAGAQLVHAEARECGSLGSVRKDAPAGPLTHLPWNN